MPNLTPESAYALFTEKHPNATLKDAFTAAWQMATVRSPEASGDAKYELYRRLYGLRIQNLRINEKLEVNWIALDCNGVESSLEAVAAPRASLTDEQHKLIEAAADCISEAVTYEQDGFDTPPGPASQWDYNADQLAYALRNMLRADKEGT